MLHQRLTFMKKLIIIGLFIVFHICSYSQNLDLIVTTNGDSIACKIDKLSEKYIYYVIKIDDKRFPNQLKKDLIADYWINSNKKMYKTWLTLKSEPFKSKGILYQSKESSILIVPMVKNRQLISDKYIVDFQISNIETIKLRRHNKIGKGILVGAITGLVAGGLIGLIDGDDPPGTWFALRAEEKAIIAGVPLAVCGAGIGAIIGSVKIKIPINGSSEKYRKNKSSLRRYSVKN
jgi:hypothetical protein